jgi:hypothetical protein
MSTGMFLSDAYPEIALADGDLKSLEPAEPHAQTVCALTESLEPHNSERRFSRNLKESERTGFDTQSAHDAGIGIIIEFPGLFVHHQSSGKTDRCAAAAGDAVIFFEHQLTHVLAAADSGFLEICYCAFQVLLITFKLDDQHAISSRRYVGIENIHTHIVIADHI